MLCVNCQQTIFDKHYNSKYCSVCAKEIQNNQKREWWRQNKHRYKRRHLTRLGNPQQDKEILKFIECKRLGYRVNKYKALPSKCFKHNNHAFYPQYKDEIINGDISYD